MSEQQNPHQLQGMGIVDPMPVQLTSHRLYGILPDSEISAAGEVPNRVTTLGRLVHGFPVNIPASPNYAPTPQTYKGAGFKFNDVKGNPPFLPNGSQMTGRDWDLAYNRADSVIVKWYREDQKFEQEEYAALKAEDRALGITRQEAILELMERGTLAPDYVDSPQDQ